jgi:hypothetical protein
VKITRRGFIGGVIAAVVARKLPVVHAAPVPEFRPTDTWEMYIYGTPLIYVSDRVRVVVPRFDPSEPGT